MQIEQKAWSSEKGWRTVKGDSLEHSSLVLLFGSQPVLSRKDILENLNKWYEDAIFLGCTTAGEICNKDIYQNQLVSTAMQFENTRVNGTETHINATAESYDVGQKIGKSLSGSELAHILVLSDGLVVNGSELTRGIHESVRPDVTISGGLAGDYYDFGQTYVLFNDDFKKQKVAAIGFYGDNIKIGHGCFGGWDSFGPDRRITKSNGNILYELDNQPALDLYKRYLGPYSNDLPASGLLFPLSIRTDTDKQGEVRTILSVDEDENSLIFAGDMPEGSYARLMKANHNRLLDGAHEAAGEARRMHDESPDLALLISCVGRKMVMKQRTEEELEEVSEILGDQSTITGFYSYGEIAPHSAGNPSMLHNQTMCITTISE